MERFHTFAPDRVRVNVVCPGVTNTLMLAEFMSRDGDAVRAAANLEKFLESVPLRRLCHPEEIANAVLWLASDDSSYVTGIELPVDGGFTCQ